MRLALALAAWLAAAPASATDLRTAAQEDSEPKYWNENGKVVGLCVDIMRAMEKVDPALHFVGDQQWMPLKRIELLLRSGELDTACGFIRTKDREASYRVIEPRLFPVKYHLVVRADDKVAVHNWDEVRALGNEGVILVNAGSGPVRHLEEQGGLLVDSGGRNSIQNLQKLQGGRGRFFYYRIPGLSSEIRRAGLRGKVRPLQPPIEVQDFYLMAGRHLSPDTLARLGAAVKALDDNGTLAQLLDKWDEY